MSIEGYIRIVGQHHATHHQGAVIGVTRNAALSNPEVVHVDQAHVMVERGDAEWVRGGGAVQTPESNEQRKARQRDELLRLTVQHNREHQGLMNRYAGEFEAPQARDMRHLTERRRLMEFHRREAGDVLLFNADASLTPQQKSQAWQRLVNRQADEMDKLHERQDREAVDKRSRQHNDHHLLLNKQANETQDLIERHAAENKAAAQAKPKDTK